MFSFAPFHIPLSKWESVIRKNHPTRGTRGQNTCKSHCIVFNMFFILSSGYLSAFWQVSEFPLVSYSLPTLFSATSQRSEHSPLSYL